MLDTMELVAATLMQVRQADGQIMQWGGDLTRGTKRALLEDAGGNFACIGCIGCIGCVGCIGCIGCVGCIGSIGCIASCACVCCVATTLSAASVLSFLSFVTVGTFCSVVCAAVLLSAWNAAISASALSVSSYRCNRLFLVRDCARCARCRQTRGCRRCRLCIHCQFCIDCVDCIDCMTCTSLGNCRGLSERHALQDASSLTSSPRATGSRYVWDWHRVCAQRALRQQRAGVKENLLFFCFFLFMDMFFWGGYARIANTRPVGGGEWLHWRWV